MADMESGLDATTPKYDFHREAIVGELRTDFQPAVFLVRCRDAKITGWPVYISVDIELGNPVVGEVFDYPIVFGQTPPTNIPAAVITVEEDAALEELSKQLEQL